jgi:hypothetical protein
MKKLSYAFVFVALIMLFASSTSAQTVPTDPKIGIGGCCSSGPFNQTDCAASTTDVPAPCSVALVNGTGSVEIINNTGFNIISDTFGVASPFDQSASDLLVCVSSNTFGLNNVSGGGASNTSCTFALPGSGDDSEHPEHFNPPGIATGTYEATFTGFTIGGTAITGKLLFDIPAWQTGNSPVVPEPATMLLLGTGLLTVAASRKKLKGAKHVA